MAESSVERDRRLKRKRKHLLQESSVERGNRLKQKHVVKRGTPLKSDLTYKKIIRYSRKKQFEADREKQFRAKMAARRKHRIEIETAEACEHEYDVNDHPPIFLHGVYNPPTIFTPCGGIHPIDIDGRDSGRLTGYCKTALKAFNKHNHQDPKFDFDSLVKANRLLPGYFYITFKAKKQDDASPTIFQASVKKKFDRSIEVISCAIKKD